jgi:hypothetical protein
MIAPLDLAAGMSEHVRTARLRRSHIIGPEEIPEPGVEFGYLSDADQQNWLDCAEAALDLLTPHIVAAREEGAREARVASVKRETVQKWLVKVVHPRIAAGKAREIRRAIEHRDLGHLLYELLQGDRDEAHHRLHDDGDAHGGRRPPAPARRPVDHGRGTR